MLLGTSHVQEATGRANSFALPSWKCQTEEGNGQKLLAKLLKGSGNYVVSMPSHRGCAPGMCPLCCWAGGGLAHIPTDLH